MSYRVETIAGQVFISVSGNSGTKRMLTPLAAIQERKAAIASLASERTAIEAEAAGIVKAMRAALADGTDTSEYRERMDKLKTQDSDMKNQIEAANQAISGIRSAATKAEAEAMSADAASRIATALSTIAIGEHLHA